MVINENNIMDLMDLMDDLDDLDDLDCIKTVFVLNNFSSIMYFISSIRLFSLSNAFLSVHLSFG